MILNIKKRLLILNLLPKFSTISEQEICREIGKKIELDEETIKKIDLNRDENNHLKWDVSKEELLQVDFSFDEITLLKKLISELNKKEQVSCENLEICLDINSL